MSNKNKLQLILTHNIPGFVPTPYDYPILPSRKIKWDGVQMFQEHDKAKRKAKIFTSSVNRCDGMNMLRTMGWIIRSQTNPENYEDPLSGWYKWDDSLYTRFFPEWEKRQVWKHTLPIYAIPPEGKKLLMMPLNHSDNDSWIPVSGVLDRSLGPVMLSVFILAKKNIIPNIKPGTPLCQMLLVDDNETEVVERNADLADMNNHLMKNEYMNETNWQKNDPGKKDLKDVEWYHYE